jgi:hypothetical protein
MNQVVQVAAECPRVGHNLRGKLWGVKLRGTRLAVWLSWSSLVGSRVLVTAKNNAVSPQRLRGRKGRSASEPSSGSPANPSPRFACCPPDWPVIVFA